MKIKELINELKCFDEDMEIMFSYPSGDYLGRILAKEPSNFYEQRVKWSEYHNSYQHIDNDDDNYYEDDDDNSKLVVIVN